MKLDIVVVNYNSGKYLQRCLDALHRTNGVFHDSQIIVYDNGSVDGSLANARKSFPRVLYMGNHINFGFARAVNHVIRKVHGDYVLLVNPDAVVFPESIRLMVEFMHENEKCGVLGGELLSPQGYSQPCCRRFPNYVNVLFGRRSIARRLFPNNRLSRTYLYSDIDANKPHKVDFVEGSLMMLRRKALDEVGYFDENFFLYVEDADICYRMMQKGWETWWLPRSYAIHYRGETFRRDNIHPAMHHSRGLYKFFCKHYNPPKLLRLVLKLSLALRLVYVIATGSLKKVFHDIDYSPPR